MSYKQVRAVSTGSTRFFSARKRIGLGVVATGLLAWSLPGFGQDSLEDCVGLSDAAERLACYDRLAGAGPAAPIETQVVTEASPAPPAASRAAQVDAPVAQEPALQQSPEIATTPDTTPNSGQEAEDGAWRSIFGLELRRRKKEEENTNAITIVVDSASHNQFTGWRIRTEDGQVWQQIGTHSYTIREGQEYEINRGSFNSFQLGNSENNRKIRVRREE